MDVGFRSIHIRANMCHRLVREQQFVIAVW
jgi:hypothetical protein